ncbi:MAG: tyrosine-type recombinase/integrase [Nanoarchaeota archaeon]|nr:tyrosine-type recombinase/integrase [Nanoarchaeota archaeon]
MDELYLMKREMLRRCLSHKTIVTYVQCVKQFMRSSKKDLKQVTKKDIKEYLNHLVDEGACGNTLNVHLNALKFMMEEVLNKRVILRIKYSKTPKTLPVYLTKEEVLRLFDAVPNPVHKLILELIYSAGLRLSEVVNLEKNDLEFENNLGWVRRGKGNKDRPFIIARCLKEKLQKHIATTDTRYVFAGRNGRHLHPRSVQEIVRQATKKAGIKKNIHPHSLRHSFATHLIEDGHDVATIQPLLGHNSAETTLVYVHMASPAILKVRSPYDRLKNQNN